MWVNWRWARRRRPTRKLAVTRLIGVRRSSFNRKRSTTSPAASRRRSRAAPSTLFRSTSSASVSGCRRRNTAPLTALKRRPLDVDISRSGQPHRLLNVLYLITYFIVLSLLTVSAVLWLPTISLQSSVAGLRNAFGSKLEKDLTPSWHNLGPKIYQLSPSKSWKPVPLWWSICCKAYTVQAPRNASVSQ